MNKVNITIQEQDDVCRIHVKGRLTVQQAKGFRERVQEVLNSTLPVQLHLGEVSSIDVAGIQLSIALKQALRAQGRCLEVTFPTDKEIMSLLENSGITKIYQYV